MPLDLTSIPSDFGAGGANIGDGAPKLGELLEEHRAGLADHDSQLGTIGPDVTALNQHKEKTAGTTDDFVNFEDDSDVLPGTLLACNGEAPGVFMALNKAAIYDDSEGITQSMSPMEVLGASGVKMWVRLDKLGRPLKSRTTLYVGCAGTPLAKSGLTPSDGFMSFYYMGDQFSNSCDGLHESLDIILTEHASFPVTFIGGDFGGGQAAEASTTTAAGDVVAVGSDGRVAPALADSDAHAAQAIGVAQHRAAPDEDNPRRAIVFKYQGPTKWNPETGISFAPSDLIYISAAEPGHVTNVAPEHARVVGLVTSVDESGVIGLARF